MNEFVVIEGSVIVLRLLAVVILVQASLRNRNSRLDILLIYPLV